MMARKRKQRNRGKWLWEFSKRLVLVCSMLYVFGFLYSCLMMWLYQDFSYLGVFMEQSTDILKTCVFGYFVKAGVENIIKIKKNSPPDQDGGAAG